MGSVLKAFGVILAFAILIPFSILIGLLAVLAIYFRAFTSTLEELFGFISDWLEDQWPW